MRSGIEGCGRWGGAGRPPQRSTGTAHPERHGQPAQYGEQSEFGQKEPVALGRFVGKGAALWRRGHA